MQGFSVQQLLQCHADAAAHLAGKTAFCSERHFLGQLFPVPSLCAEALEAAWTTAGAAPPLADAFIEGFSDLWGRGVDVEVPEKAGAKRRSRQKRRAAASNGPPVKNFEVLEFLAVACAPGSVVDEALSLAKALHADSERLGAALLAAIRCHRRHMFEALLELLPLDRLDPRPLATACYAKNVAAVSGLLARRADPNLACPRQACLYPRDDVFASETGGEATALELAVRGRAWLDASRWAEAPRVVQTLLDAGASASRGRPLDALLGQGRSIVRRGGYPEDAEEADEAVDAAWQSAFHALLAAGAEPSGSPIRQCARPEYALAILDALGSAVASPGDEEAITMCAMRAVWADSLHRRTRFAWQLVVRSLLKLCGEVAISGCTANLAVQDRDEAEFQSLPGCADLKPFILEANDVGAPFPVLSAALTWGDRELVDKSLSQTAIDGIWAVKMEHNTCSWLITMMYKVARSVGGRSVEAAYVKGIRFPSAPLWLGGHGHLLMGPVATLAVVASELHDEVPWVCWGCGALNKEERRDADVRGPCSACGERSQEVAELAAAACFLLELGCDDPAALVTLAGVPGGLGRLRVLMEGRPPKLDKGDKEDQEGDSEEDEDEEEGDGDGSEGQEVWPDEWGKYEEGFDSVVPAAFWIPLRLWVAQHEASGSAGSHPERHGFDGCWINCEEQRTVAVISGNDVAWASGEKRRLDIAGQYLCSTTRDGVPMSGELIDDGFMRWTVPQTDVSEEWVRAKHAGVRVFVVMLSRLTSSTPGTHRFACSTLTGRTFEIDLAREALVADAKVLVRKHCGLQDVACAIRLTRDAGTVLRGSDSIGSAFALE